MVVGDHSAFEEGSSGDDVLRLPVRPEEPVGTVTPETWVFVDEPMLMTVADNFGRKLAEGTLELPSGRLVVTAEDDVAAGRERALKVPPGSYEIVVRAVHPTLAWEARREEELASRRDTLLDHHPRWLVVLQERWGAIFTFLLVAGAVVSGAAWYFEELSIPLCTVAGLVPLLWALLIMFGPLSRVEEHSLSLVPDETLPAWVVTLQRPGAGDDEG